MKGMDGVTCRFVLKAVLGGGALCSSLHLAPHTSSTLLMWFHRDSALGGFGFSPHKSPVPSALWFES